MKTDEETKSITIPSLVIQLNLSYIPMGNHNSESSLFNEFEPDNLTPDQENTEAIKPEILTDDMAETSDLSSEAIAVSIVSEESPLDRDWFNLARKLRGQNRELLDTIVKLEQELALSRQHLQEQVQRSHHISEQTSQQQTRHAQNSNLVEQLHTSQQDKQKQQLEIETLQQNLFTVQETLAQIEREYALLKEECQNKTNHLAIAQRQVNELQTRLKRQQRFTLQYKAALDECLSNCARKTKTSAMTPSSSSEETLAPTMLSIQPWSSRSTVKSSADKVPPATVSGDSKVDSIDQTLEELFSVTTEAYDSIEERADDQDLSSDETNQKSSSQSMIVSQSQSLVMNSPVPFSFSIDRRKKEEAARAKIDLPAFLRHS